MNNPDEFPVDVKEMREWIMSYRELKGLSWGALARASGIPQGTISPFCSTTYAGNEQNVARKIFKYRQLVESQEERAVGIPEAPEMILTPTAQRLRGLLIMAQRGRVTVAATGPGTSKTMTAEDYQRKVANVWIATMRPTTSSVAGMLAEVLRAVGGDPKQGWNRQMSAQIVAQVAGKGGLIIVDEAGNLCIDGLEELRAIHDATGVGLALFGNEDLIRQIRGGRNRHQLARLNSRIAMSLLQDLPLEADVDDYLDAWQIEVPTMRAMLKKIALSSGAGGLREIRQIIEHAAMFAQDDGRDMSLTDLREAHSTRASRFIRVDV